MKSIILENVYRPPSAWQCNCDRYFLVTNACHCKIMHRQMIQAATWINIFQMTLLRYNRHTQTIYLKYTIHIYLYTQDTIATIKIMNTLVMPQSSSWPLYYSTSAPKFHPHWSLQIIRHFLKCSLSVII